MHLHIPVSPDHVRSIKDPKRPKVKIVHALVPVSGLPTDIPLDPDPRVPKVKGPVIRRITDSLRTNDGRFHLLNRGITISASDVEYDNRKRSLSLYLAKDENHGIIDGGHTYKAITTVARPQAEGDSDPGDGDLPDLASQFVHLEVLVGIEADLADIAEARNFSVSLKPWTLAGYRDKFKWFLDALGDDFCKHVKTSENDPEPVSILDLVQVICALNPDLFRDSAPAVEAYKNAGKCLEYFVDAEDRWHFKKLKPVCRDIVKLYDYVRANWKTKYNTEDELGRRGRLGGRAETQQRKRNRKAMATYYFLAPGRGPVEGDLPIEKGLAIPLIASFRALLDGDSGLFKWYADPFAFFDKYGSRLIRLVMSASDQAGGDPHLIGRDPQVYSALYSEVRRWYLEGRVASLEKDAAAG